MQKKNMNRQITGRPYGAKKNDVSICYKKVALTGLKLKINSKR